MQYSALQTSLTRYPESPALRTILLAALCAGSALVSACEVSDGGPEFTPVETPVNPAQDAGGEPADNDGGTPNTPNTPAPREDAGTSVSDPDAGLPGATDAGDPDSAAPSGPLPLPAPDQPGPYNVVMVDNVGEGFENAINSNDQGMGGSFCRTFVSLFTDDPQVIEEYSVVPASYRMDLYTLYYPEGAPGQRFPVLSWANGTCAHTVGYEDMIKHVVSHGFIVIAPHSRFTADGTAQLGGIDWVLSQDTVESSPLYGRVNKDLIGLFGHSQGGGSTGIASEDPRVKTSILMHGGSSSRLHAPALLLTGDGDISPSGVRNNYNNAKVPAAFGSLKMSDHVTMMEEPDRMAPEVVAWFRYQLLQDAVAKSWYVGNDCVLCTDSEWEYAQKNLQ